MILMLLALSNAAFADPNFVRCNQAADCMVVQDGWCKRVSSILKTRYNDWKSLDEEYVDVAKERKQDCRPAFIPETDLKNYHPDCYDHTCKAVSNGG